MRINLRGLGIATVATQLPQINASDLSSATSALSKATGYSQTSVSNMATAYVYQLYASGVTPGTITAAQVAQLLQQTPTANTPQSAGMSTSSALVTNFGVNDAQAVSQAIQAYLISCFGSSTAAVSAIDGVTPSQAQSVLNSLYQSGAPIGAVTQSMVTVQVLNKAGIVCGSSSSGGNDGSTSTPFDITPLLLIAAGVLILFTVNT